jgi:RND family efflux transporter MFP subunit
MLAYAKIRAPYDGVVTMRKVNTGDLVQPAAGKGDWLFVVARLDPVRVVIDVPEADAALVDEKTQVSLSIPALRLPALQASVARTSWALAPGARTLRTEIDLPNKDGKYRPGTYVFARLTGEQHAGWALPSSALVKQGDATVCFLIENGKAVRTPVQVGRGDGEFTEVLKLQRPPAASWADWTGKEEVAAKAAGLSDGQAVERSLTP